MDERAADLAADDIYDANVVVFYLLDKHAVGERHHRRVARTKQETREIPEQEQCEEQPPDIDPSGWWHRLMVLRIA